MVYGRRPPCSLEPLLKVSAIVLAVAIGAGATWLWQNREARSALDSTSQPYRCCLHETDGGARTGHPSATPAATTTAAEAARPSNPTPMTSAAGQRERPRGRRYDLREDAGLRAVPGPIGTPEPTTRRATSPSGARVFATPDDPDWARKTEQSMWDFFQKKSASGDGPQVTSVSCRSSGCEVQALESALRGGTPCELQHSRKTRRAAPENGSAGGRFVAAVWAICR